VPQAARSLYEALRALEHRAGTARTGAGLPCSRRLAASTAARPPYGALVDSRRISAWLPDDAASAQVPRAADEVWALVRVWSDWAGDPVPDRRYWINLVDAAQPERARTPSEAQPQQSAQTSTEVNNFAGQTHNVIQFHSLQGDLLIGPSSSRKDEPVGRLIPEMADPFALEVHRPIEIARSGVTELPPLPPYIARKHDGRIAEIVAHAASGQSAVGVLVGGSSTGKTRACWEAIQMLPPGWRLWHPIFPDRTVAFLSDLERVGPCTVVWLNEAQHYLLTRDPAVGERVAAGLRDLLRHRDRGPVLVLGTMWPEYWGPLALPPLAGGPDPHGQARMLLAGVGIEVPDAFTGPALTALAAAAQGDPRLAQAADQAEDGQVTQFLAGVPALLERCRTAPPAAKAVIHAAVDACRLGHGPTVPYSLLEAAAPGYLTDQQWEQAGEDWLEQALAYTAAPCNGVRGPVTRIRARPTARPAGGPGGATPRQATDSGGPRYRLADYLQQTGGRDRADQLPPGTFWDAMLTHADPVDLLALAHRAFDRGLFRYAALLYKHAVTAGHARAAGSLVIVLSTVESYDTSHVGYWIAAHADLTDPYAVASLLRALHGVGDRGAVAALVAPAAAQVDLAEPGGVAHLLEALRDVGSGDAVAVLLARDPAAHADLTDPNAVASLLRALCDVGGGDAVAALAARAAAHADPINPVVVASLLEALHEVDCADAVAVLLARDPAAHADLTNSFGVASLLRALCDVGGGDAVAALAARAAAHADLTNPNAVASLLRALRDVGGGDAVAALAAHAAAHADLTNPFVVASLLEALHEVDCADAVAVLLAQDPAGQADLTEPYAIAYLLRVLREVGCGDAIVALAARIAAQTDLAKPGAVPALLRALRAEGCADAVAALAGRAAAHGDLTNSFAVALLLEALHEVDCADAVAVLLAQNPAAHVDLTDSRAVASLLKALRTVGCADAVAALLARDPAAQADLTDMHAVTPLLEALHEVGCMDVVASLAVRIAAHVELTGWRAIGRLLYVLREVGAEGAAASLAGRAANYGIFPVLRDAEPARFPFGREPDGTPSSPWGWHDLG
jgi:hypothetical protein